jgi:hypothetical protein
MKNIYYLLLVVFLSNCYLPRYKNDYTQCYTANTNPLNSKLKLNGYFYGNFSIDSNNGYSIMLFQDGTITTNVHLNRGKSDIIRGRELYKNPGGWGTFIIRNNIIISQDFHSSMSSSGLVETSFKIQNDSTLLMLSSKILCGPSSGVVIYNDPKSKDYIFPLKFIKLENKPDSSCWLKEKKWFWCDKQKYNEYMKFDKTRSELYYEPKKK